jgi:hypothetical protein
MKGRAFSEKPRDEDGFISVVALFILVVLTMLGVMGTTTSQVEIQMAGHEKSHKIAFHNADSSIYATPKLISICIENNSEQDVAGVTYLGNDGTFYRELMGFDAHDSDRDIRFILAGFNVDADVNRTGVQYSPGGGIQFASGAEGVGSGSAGSVGILYEMDSLGEGPTLSASNIVGVYRKVVGVPGGL